MADQNTVLGQLTAPYGIKGWIKIHSFTVPMDNIFDYAPWKIKRGDEIHTLELESGKRHGKGLIAKLAGINTPEAATAWRGSEIIISVDQLPELEAGEYYWSQLEGLEVYTESGELLGRVDHLIETGSNDVLVVVPSNGSIDQRERLLPYLMDQVIKTVDLTNNRLRVDWDPEF